jgi:two-component system, OmpR family, response regulator
MRPVTPVPPVDDASSLADTALFVVDDDQALVDSLLDLLLDEGYEARGFTRPLEALALLRAGARPRAVLLDYVMPEMSGDEFIAALAAAEVDVPVLLLSGVSDPSLEGAVAAVLPKPFDLDQLLATIARFVDRVEQRVGRARARS